MTKFEAWTITLAILAVMRCIPRWIYRWALVSFVLVPLGVALVLAL
jgi:hypothetical protein